MKQLLQLSILTFLFFSCNQQKATDTENTELPILEEFQKLQERVLQLEETLENHKHLKVGDTHAGGIIFYLDETEKHGKVCSKIELGNFISWREANSKCKASKEGGFEDWYLPTMDELDQIYSHLHKRGLGGFVNNSYMSSELDDRGANVQTVYFVNGSHGLGAKNSQQNSIYARAVRTF